MNDDGLKKIEHILLYLLLGLGVIAILGILCLINMTQESAVEVQDISTEEESTEDTYDWEAGLSDSTLWLPDNCALYEQLPDFTIEDEAGNVRHISDFEGTKTVIVFWASWCEDCQEQMPHMKDYIKLADAYGEIQFLFINKTDGSKETKNSSKVYFDELALDIPLYYDIDLYAYNSLGLHNIPTTLFLDETGRVITWSPKQITENSTFEAYLNCLSNGNSMATEQFVTERLMDENGGIHSEFDASKEITDQSDVLSESQGLLMQYAVAQKNQELFDQLWVYVSTCMLKDGLAAWTITGEAPSRVNALLDDLRIYQALSGAQNLWGGYETMLEEYQKNLAEFGMKEEQFVDFYDAENKQKADRLTLCYIDLQTMQQLAEQDTAFEQAYQSARRILVQGQISDSFPLYYSWYDYDSGKYQKDELNMAEAMVTLLHLAQENLLPDPTIKWLKNQMSGNGIKARMNVKGEVVSGYNYDSTAVYALIVLIADEIEDDTLRGQALRKMEKMRNNDMSLTYNGAFGMEDGSDIQSFDQLLPLLVYAQMENK